MPRNIINLEKVQSVYNGNLESLVHTSDLDNGAFVNIGALVAGERELKNVVIPATATLGTEEIVVIASDEVIKDSVGAYSLGDFFNKANEPMKAYHLEDGDVLKISATAFDGTLAVGKYLIPQNGSTKLIVSDTIGSTRFSAKILSITETIGYEKAPAVRLQVVKK